MSSYPLEDILRFRNQRADAAQRKAMAALREELRVSDELEAARKRLEEYKCWRVEEIERRYVAFLQEQTTKRGIELFHESVKSLEFREVELGDEVVRAEKKLQDAKAYTLECKQEAMQAQKAMMKLDLHKQEWVVEAKKKAQLEEEKELEELAFSKVKLFNK
ncbi:type III secretion system stalk subunit SctO [Halodesulfovibrio marinisediminis]|uniref:Type III secretion protein YscO n=1 Tax=Halodesulfovibrio marinisediminis DSM 17456 TaxID=1121457 RepID=A0A1N6I8Z9_9BACT|nr:YscO family type III secretion system apparatus protein [Halodesulfovibrio marinisediminis]SIO28449.1 Type III secretion protein YscO [Halodesulfovibrio marinisediminis DSM 17456]